MINAKGEVIYTNAEIAYELGISPATVNAVGRRLFGNRIAYWNINDVKMICHYIKSISAEEDAKRIAILHNTIREIMGDCALDEDDKRKRVDKDINLRKE